MSSRIWMDTQTCLRDVYIVEEALDNGRSVIRPYSKCCSERVTYRTSAKGTTPLYECANCRAYVDAPSVPVPLGFFTEDLLADDENAKSWLSAWSGIRSKDIEIVVES